MSDRSNLPDGSALIHATPYKFVATDGYELIGKLWQSTTTKPHTALLVNCATGVVARYYERYAAHLANNGFVVLTYDYRGIGQSRPYNLKGFKATKHDWGTLDCEAALQALMSRAPSLPIMAVCHSIGGFALALAPSAIHVQRALFVGCQYAYWQDYRALRRIPLWLRWHIIMPLLTVLVGYFPGKKLGWLEDLPAGVALEWATRIHPVFHRRYHRLPHTQPPDSGTSLEARSAKIHADILAIADYQDEFATPIASHRLLNLFRQSDRYFVQINPAAEGLPTLGHFGFFHDRFRNTLWADSLEWLKNKKLPWSAKFRLTPESTYDD